MSGSDVSRPQPEPTGLKPLPLLQQLGYLALGIVVLTLSFSAAGAFDTDELGLAHRLALWCVVGTLMLVQPWLIEYGLARLVPRTRKWRMACLVLAVLLCNLALTFQLHALKSTPLLPKAPDPLIDFYIFLAPAVMPVALLVLLLKLGFSGRVALSPAVDGAPGLLLAPGLRTLNSDWRDEAVSHIRAEDHYLEIHTEKARYFVRGRLADAVDRLSGTDGLQVHRSWWVADRAVALARRQGRDFKLTLVSGETVPVSRNRIEDVRARGWLARTAASRPTS